MNEDYQNYGCEYLDLEDYKHPKVDNWLWLPIDFIFSIADSEYLYKISLSAQEKISNLQLDIKVNSFKEPGKIIISPTAIKLQDGNHRLIASNNLEYKKYPIIIEYTDGKIKSGGIKLQSLMEELLCLKK